ncbi:MAG: hypothetical protein AAF985_18365, partial [Bacteroidota bacterium]
AQHQIIEMGIRLRTFTNYFIDESEANFKKPILEKLKAGVNFHCYILTKNGRFAADYFKDRAKVQAGEEEAYKEMTLVRDKLCYILKAINEEDTKGKMHLYQYNCFPYFHATAIDLDRVFGKICITQYLYGISRANSPRFKLNQKKNMNAYGIYKKSIKSIISQSQKINLENIPPPNESNRQSPPS